MNCKTGFSLDKQAEEASAKRTGAMLDSLVDLLRQPVETAAKEGTDDDRLRVAVYCQVARNADHQVAIDLQKSQYQAKIATRPDWTYAGIYADVGPFGREEERPEFNRMMRDAEEGRFDMLITRSIGRFVRSMDELEMVLQRLKELDVPVYFELQRIYSSNTIEEILKIAAKCEADNKRRKNEAMRKSMAMR